MSKVRRRRLDLLLVERGLTGSRSAAQRVIRAGEVTVDGQRVDKPGTSVPEDARIDLREEPRWVSQGGIKLEKAIREFAIQVRGRICLDVGASTGGFTDCLLQHGAKKVYAVDVGKGQLDWSLRNDPRVVPLEGINARYLKPEQIGEPVDLATVDVSFISLAKIAPALIPIVKPGGEIIVLVKPQFEAGHERVKPGGVVSDPGAHSEVLERLARHFAKDGGLSVLHGTYSPVTGPAGNIEFFMHLVKRRDESRRIDWDKLAESARRELGK